MDIRKKLVALAIFNAVLCVVLIGMTAYEGNQEVAARQKIETLHLLLDQFGDLVVAASSTRHKKSGDNRIFVKSFTGSVSADLVKKNLFDEQFKNWSEIYKTGKGGFVKAGEKIYGWAYRRNKDRTVAAYHKVEKLSFRTFLQTTGGGLLGTGIFILYISIWSLIMIASLIRKLDAKNEELKIQANHDHLTGLPNRACLTSYLDELIDQSSNKNSMLIIVVMDLDQFKEKNDKNGHTFGDKLLKQTADCIRSSIRESDFAARMGGDEFILVFENTTLQELEEITTRLLHTLEFGSQKYSIRASLGAAIYPLHGRTTDNVIRHADMAMYESKKARKGLTVYEREQLPPSVLIAS